MSTTKQARRIIPIVIFLAAWVSTHCVSGQRAQAAPPPPENAQARTIYIIQSYYHTGITLELDNEARSKLEFAEQYSRYRYVDIGWGEEVFYQDPEFTLCKAAKAIFVPSSSVVRVEGFNQDISNVIAWSDRAVKISITMDQFSRLCAYINGSLKKEIGGKLVVASSKGNGGILFYKSPLTYDLFNTCNTWVARALRHAGIDVSPVCVVTAASLFSRLKNKGAFLKQ